MRPRGLIIALVISVALNLFLFGLGAGVITLAMNVAREGAPRPAALLLATQHLPQPARANIRQMLRGVRDQVRADADRSRTLRLQAWGAMAAPKPDAAAIKQTLAQSRQIDIAVRAKVEESIVDFAATLSPADRATLAAGFRQELSPPATK